MARVTFDIVTNNGNTVTIIGNSNRLFSMSKDTQRITQINDQGEIVGGFVAVIRPKQKSSFQRHFTMNQDALKILAKELTGEQFKVLMLMLADLDYENFIQIAQADIADALEMQRDPRKPRCSCSS